MRPSEYIKPLIEECKRLDSYQKNNKLFEQLAIEIVEGNNNAPLMLINQLGLLKKNQPKLEKINVKIIELLYLYLGSKQVDDNYQKLKFESNYTLEELQNQLNQLVGLNVVKNQVNDLIIYNKIQKVREKQGLKMTSKTMHMAFLGNPGTAKTTVARIVGKIYKSLGLLSKGHFIEASRTDLIAEYQGQTAIKVKKLINRAKGGVLFIDEAYSITENDQSDSFGRECLTELTKALEDYRDDLVVIVAGYPDLMNTFFESNPGLKSRFNTFIQFPDYTLDELVSIFNYTCKDNDYLPSKEALIKVREFLKIKLEENDTNFSNGRFVRNMFDDIVLNQSKRLVSNINSLNKNSLIEIKAVDISWD